MAKKSLFKNSIYNSIYSLLTVLFPLITIPYLSRILQPDGIGKINYSTNIVSWFLLFASLGIPRYGVRAIAICRENENRLKKTTSELLTINFISTSVCSLLYITMMLLVPYFKSRKALYIATGLHLFLNIFNVDWFYQGLEEYSYITKRSITIKLLTLICIFTFIKTKEDYIRYAYLQSIALAGNYLWNFVHLKYHTRISLKGLNLRQHLGPVWVLLSTTLAVSIYALLDTLMIGIWCDDTVVGYYSNAQKIVKIIATLSASIAGVMLPRLSTYCKEGEYNRVTQLSMKVQDVLITLCVPVTVGIIILAKEIVLVLFGDSFTASVLTLRIFAPFILFTTIGNLYGTQLLMALNQEKNLLASVVIGACINCVLNAFLIPIWAQNGAALASVCTEFIVMILQIKMVNKKLQLRTDIKFLLNIGFSTVIMSILVIGIKRIISSNLIILLCSSVVGAVVYFCVGILSKNRGVLFIKDTILEKIIKKKRVTI